MLAESAVSYSLCPPPALLGCQLRCVRAGGRGQGASAGTTDGPVEADRRSSKQLNQFGCCPYKLQVCNVGEFFNF